MLQPQMRPLPLHLQLLHEQLFVIRHLIQLVNIKPLDGLPVASGTRRWCGLSRGRLSLPVRRLSTWLDGA